MRIRRIVLKPPVQGFVQKNALLRPKENGQVEIEVLSPFKVPVPENKTYGPLLLRRLFRDMALFAGWQAGRRLQERDLETRSLFAESRKRYLGEYWNSRGIKWSEKMLCLSMSAFPPLAWLVLKWTRNR